MKIMKKIYMKPELEVVLLNTNTQLLAGSVNSVTLDPSQEFGVGDEVGAPNSDMFNLDF